MAESFFGSQRVDFNEKTPGNPGVLLSWRKCMGIEPTWDAPQRPTPDLKSGSPTSELGTSTASFTKTLTLWQDLGVKTGKPLDLMGSEESTRTTGPFSGA